MSIALEARVAELEARVAQWMDAHLRLQGQLSEAMDHLLKANDRIVALEQRGKPGPKPKDSNG